jgi:hypothetical protein
MIAAALIGDPPQQERAAVIRRRLTWLVVVFALWAALGAVIGWTGIDWAVYGVAAVVAVLVSIFLSPHRSVFGVTFALTLFVFVVVAAIDDDDGEDPRPAGSTSSVPTIETRPPATDFQRSGAERTVRGWFSARRAGDETALCILETPALAKRHGGCDRASPIRSTPKGADVVIDSVDPLDGGDLDVRVHAGAVRATLRLTGAGLYRVAAVTGLPDPR